MIERLIENWLVSASEKEFQVPFCHVLTQTGSTVVHMTRHCSLEMGKDIIAISQDGTPCAYQLKSVGGLKLSKDEWRNLMPQMDELVRQSIVHTAIKPGKLHRSFLVINGDLEEEATAAIEQYNSNLLVSGYKKEQQLQVIVKGQLYKAFMDLGTNLWPFGLKETRSLITLYLEVGDGCFPKENLAVLLERVLPLKRRDGEDRKTSKAECQRALTSSAILCSLASTSFTRLDNHAAVFEAWTVYTAYALFLSEQYNLPDRYWRREVNLGLNTMYEALCRLWEEISSRNNLVEGSAVSDFAFYNIRTTYLVALVAMLGLWRKHKCVPPDSIDDSIRAFIKMRLPEMMFWGEYATPQFLAAYFYLDAMDATLWPTQYLGGILSAVVKLGQPQKGRELPNPYCNPEEYVLETMCRGPQEKTFNFQDGSFSIEALMYLFVRTNMKQRMKQLWPDITRVEFKRVVPNTLSDYYGWHIEEGVTDSIFLPPRKEWEELKRESSDGSGSDIPPLMKQFPIFYLAFLCVYPHRINASGVLWLATQLNAFDDNK